MEYKHIEYFIEASKHSSMSKAAEELFISQQALSRSIANLEDELGCVLFYRSSKGISLTADGEYLYRNFAHKVEEFNLSIQNAIDYFESKPVKLSFCCAPLIFRSLDPELLFEFEEQFPNITLEMLEYSDVNCDAYVEESASHFGMIAIPENRHGERFDFTLVKTFPLYLIVHKDHPHSKEKNVSFSKLKDARVLMPDKNSYFHKMVSHYAKKNNFKLQSAFESSDANQLISLVNKGRGITINVEKMVDRSIYENVVLVPFDDESITWSIAFIYQNFDALSATAKKFIRFIVDSVE